MKRFRLFIFCSGLYLLGAILGWYLCKSNKVEVIYYPYYNKEYFRRMWQQKYMNLAFAEKYQSFMSNYVDIWLGEQFVDWSDIRAEAIQPHPSTQEITLAMKSDQKDNYAFAQYSFAVSMENLLNVAITPITIIPEQLNFLVFTAGSAAALFTGFGV